MRKDAVNQNGSLCLTQRDLELLLKLNAAGWLSTGQIRDWFFPDRSTNAVCKRLRRLAASKYVSMVRMSSTEQALYRLASRGKRALIEHLSCEETDISTPTQLPRKIDHFIAINDLRLCFDRMRKDRSVDLSFFFSEREIASNAKRLRPGVDVLLSLFGRYRIVPDAVAGLRIIQDGMKRTLNLALEYDAGTEHLAFFGRTKVAQYTKLFLDAQDIIADFKVLTVADSVKRIVSLMQQTVRHNPPRHLFYFALRERLYETPRATADLFLDPYDFFAPLRRRDRTEIVEVPFNDTRAPSHALTTLPATLPHKHSSREETNDEVKALDFDGLADVCNQGNNRYLMKDN